MKRAIVFILLSYSCLTTSCGYGFRSRSNIWEREQMTKLYVNPLLNNSLRAGVEATFTSAILKEFSRGGRIQLVSSERDADGVLTGSIDVIESRESSSTLADQLAKNLPDNQKLPTDFLIASEYAASASISIACRRKKDGMTMWQQSFSRSKIYPSGNQPGDIGNTSVLINESRLDMALNEIAQILAADVHDLFFESF